MPYSCRCGGLDRTPFKTFYHRKTNFSFCEIKFFWISFANLLNPRTSHRLAKHPKKLYFTKRKISFSSGPPPPPPTRTWQILLLLLSIFVSCRAITQCLFCFVLNIREKLKPFKLRFQAPTIKGNRDINF